MSSKKRSVPDTKSSSRAKPKAKESSSESSSSSSEDEKQNQQQKHQQISSEPSLLYTWKEVKNDEDLTRRLQAIYGLDPESAKVNGQTPSTMPWVIRDLLGDHMCPSSDPEKDIFSAPPTDDVSPDIAKVWSIIRDLAQHIRDTHGKSGKHATHVSAWITSIKKDLCNAYVDICKRFSQERGVANGILTSKRIEEEQKAKRAKLEEPKKAEKKEEEEDSSESEQEKKEEAPQEDTKVSGHDQEPSASAVSLPLPESLPPSAHAPPPTINVYKPLVKTNTSDPEELPPAPPPEMLFDQPKGEAADGEELPAAPSLDALIANDASVEPPKNRIFRVPVSGTSSSLWDGNGVISSSSVGRHPVSSSGGLYSNGRIQDVDNDEAPGYIGGMPEDEFNALASVRDHDVPINAEGNLVARSKVAVVGNKKRASIRGARDVPEDINDGQSEFEMLMRGMGAKELSATGDS